MKSDCLNLQPLLPCPNIYIAALIEEQVPVAVFLTSGIKLQGVIVGSDLDEMHLENGSTQQIIKHSAIATILPGRALKFYEATHG